MRKCRSWCSSVTICVDLDASSCQECGRQSDSGVSHSTTPQYAICQQLVTYHIRPPAAKLIYSISDEHHPASLRLSAMLAASTNLRTFLRSFDKSLHRPHCTRNEDRVLGENILCRYTLPFLTFFSRSWDPLTVLQLSNAVLNCTSAA